MWNSPAMGKKRRLSRITCKILDDWRERDVSLRHGVVHTMECRVDRVVAEWIGCQGGPNSAAPKFDFAPKSFTPKHLIGSPSPIHSSCICTSSISLAFDLLKVTHPFHFLFLIHLFSSSQLTSIQFIRCRGVLCFPSICHRHKDLLQGALLLATIRRL